MAALGCTPCNLSTAILLENENVLSNIVLQLVYFYEIFINYTLNNPNNPIVATIIVITGIIKAAVIIVFESFSFVSLSGQAAIVIAPPVENGEHAVDNPPKKIHV